MVAVAVGPAEAVAQWARLLRRTAIPYYTVTVNGLGDGTDSREAELRVPDALIDEARSAIRDGRIPGAALLW